MKRLPIPSRSTILLVLVGIAAAWVFGRDAQEWLTGNAQRARALEIIEKAEAKGETDPAIAAELAKAYQEAGVPEKRDLWLEKAAMLGDLPSAERLIQLSYRAGDTPKYLQWLEFASKNGSAKASYGLALEHFSGVLIPKDQKKGVEFLELAANQGDSWSQELSLIGKNQGIDALLNRMLHKNN